jgi:hypothetical protein
LILNLLEALNFNELEHASPSGIWEPLFNWVRVLGVELLRAVYEVVHLRTSIIDWNDLLLHQTEGQLSHEDLLVTFVEAA